MRRLWARLVEWCVPASALRYVGVAEPLVEAAIEFGVDVAPFLAAYDRHLALVAALDRGRGLYRERVALIRDYTVADHLHIASTDIAPPTAADRWHDARRRAR